MQKYFKTGKTIVIDDQYTEARPLLDALSKNQIPFFYTQGKPNSEYPLPNSDPQDAQYYSLVFLDLNLDFQFAGSQIGSAGEERTFKGTHAQILNTIIKNKNRSFIIVIWSNEEENFLPHFLQLFNDTKYTEKRPFKIISLNKPNFFSRTEDGYRFRKDAQNDTKYYEDLLFDEINKALADLETFKLFCEWDRVVSQSVSDAVDDMMGMINHIPNEDDREYHLAEILTLMSVIYSGYEGFLNLGTDQEKTDAVFLALTQILNDDIDRNVLNERNGEFTNWKATNVAEIKKLRTSVDSNLLNKKLLLYKPNKKNITGSAYKTNLPPSPYFKRILKDCFDTETTFKKIITRFKIKYKRGFEQEKKNDSQSENFLSFIQNQCIPIEVNVTPLCDIVQNKFINYRVLSGFIISADYYDCIKKNDLAFFYKSPQFSFEGKNVFIGLDLRSFSTWSKDEIEQKEYLFSLRTNLVNDIQTKLAAHVSRLGVLFV